MGTITFENVSKTFSGQTEVRALDAINLAIGEGEFVALLGPSGCGKSTLLNLLAGFEKTSEGTLLFDGKTVTRPGPDRGVVFQEAALFPWLNVWQNVIFGPQVQGVSRAEYESKARSLLKLVGLESFADALPVQLSGGMRQRVGIARVLAMSPRALLMDEPFGALDAQTRLSMQQLLLDVWQSLGTTVLFVTHDIDEAILLSDRICVMSARPGRIIRTIPITLPRPRSIASLTSAEFMAYKARIMSDMKVSAARRLKVSNGKSAYSLCAVVGSRAVAAVGWQANPRASRRQRGELAIRSADAAHDRHSAAWPRNRARRAEFLLGRLRHARRASPHPESLRLSWLAGFHKLQCRRDRCLSASRHRDARCGLGIHRSRHAPESHQPCRGRRGGA